MRIRSASRLAAAALVATCGCSFVAVRRPPPAPAAPDVSLECTQSRVAPALDTAGAIVTPMLGLTLWGLCAFTSAMQSWSSDPKHPSCGLVLAGTALSTMAYAGSALYGYGATAECRRIAEVRQMTSLRAIGAARATFAEICPDSIGRVRETGHR
jgi:hypothetical protein